jgi:hypothetical protein
MKRISFPESGWYSRGAHDTLSYWNGKKWTGEIKTVIREGSELTISESTKPNLISFQNSELVISNLKRTSSVTIPIVVAGSALAAFLYYSRKK